MYTFVKWDWIVRRFRKSSLLWDIIGQKRVTKFVFITLDGQRINIPSGSSLEIWMED